LVLPKVSHLAANCPQWLEDEKKKRDMTSVQSANLTVGDLKDLSGHEVGHIYMAATGAPSENDVLLDRGAMSHMFCECHCFGSYIPSAGDETVSIGE
jgi:hypothetical protein